MEIVLILHLFQNMKYIIKYDRNIILIEYVQIQKILFSFSKVINKNLILR